MNLRKDVKYVKIKKEKEKTEDNKNTIINTKYKTKSSNIFPTV